MSVSIGACSSDGMDAEAVDSTSLGSIKPSSVIRIIQGGFGNTRKGFSSTLIDDLGSSS